LRDHLEIIIFGEIPCNVKQLIIGFKDRIALGPIKRTLLLLCCELEQDVSLLEIEDLSLLCIDLVRVDADLKVPFDVPALKWLILAQHLFGLANELAVSDSIHDGVSQPLHHVGADKFFNGSVVLGSTFDV
jgi:hypothetical protein